MSRTYPNTILQTFSSPEWVAKAYSEHLLSCSQAILDLHAKITDVAADETLNSIVDQLSDDVETRYDAILNVVLSTLTPEEKSANPDFNDDIVQQRIMEIEYGTDYPTAKTVMDINLNALAVRSPGFYDLYHNDDAVSALVNYRSFGKFIASCTQYQNRRDNLIATALQDLGFNANAPFTLNEGFCSIHDMFVALVDNILECDIGTFSIPLKDATGVSLGSFDFASEEIFEQIKASFASCIAWGTGFAAIAKQNISDSVAYFDSNISSMISDTTEKFANTVNNVRAHITSVCGNVRDFFEIAYTELGWKSVVEDSFYKVDETDVFSYTGASPLAAVNTNFLVNVGAAIGKTVTSVGAGIFMAAKNILGKIWKKAKPFIMTMINQPVDIGVVDNSDDSYTCSNFSAQANRFFTLKYTTTQLADKLETVLHSKVDKWVALNTYFGEIFFKIDYTVRDPNDSTKVNIVYEARYRPKCLNYREAVNRGLCYINNLSAADHRITFDPLPSGSLTVINEWLDFINDDYRPSDDEDERYLFMGFWLANAMNMQMGAYAASEIFDWAGDNNIPVPDAYVFDQFNQYAQFDFTPKRVNYWLGNYVQDTNPAVPMTVNNRQLLEQTCGVSVVGQNAYFDRFPCASSSDPQLSNNTAFTLDQAMIGYIMCFIIQQWDKYDNPTDYLFLPYCNNTLNPAPGRYKVKTDAQNANIASMIAQVLIVIAVAVTTIIVVSKIHRTIKAKRLAKWSREVGMMDNDMWNGKKLTAKQARKYARYKRKIDKITGASSGLATSGSILKSIKDSVSAIAGNNVNDQNSLSGNTNRSFKTISELIGSSSNNTDASLNDITKLITGRE